MLINNHEVESLESYNREVVGARSEYVMYDAVLFALVCMPAIFIQA